MKRETKHTPGPWYVVHNGDEYAPARVVVEYGMDAINIVDSCDPCDATLIAAAPELAAALAAFLEFPSNGRQPDGYARAVINAANALRKAGLL